MPNGLKPKDLIGIPWMLAFALRKDGWYLRMDNIWQKPNPMPDSVTDRTTKAHEYIFHFSKSERYYYDRKSILEPFADSRNGADGAKISRQLNRGGRTDHYGKPNNIDPSANGGKNKRSVWLIYPQSLNADLCLACDTYFHGKERSRIRTEKVTTIDGKTINVHHCPCGATDSWVDHFAAFPPALAEPCIKAGSAIGDLVLDPFCGSGSTGIAALSHGRDFIGIDLNKSYCRLSEKRLEQFKRTRQLELCSIDSQL